MGDPEAVTQLPRPLPDAIEVSQTPDVRLTPNQIRALKEQTERTLEELMGPEADDADRMQTMVWLELRRRGHDATWEQAGDVAIKYVEEVPDPTSGEPSTSSPPSAASGA